MGCCGSSDSGGTRRTATKQPEQPPPLVVHTEEQPDAATGAQGSPACERKSTFMMGSIDTGAAVYAKQTTNEGSASDTMQSLSILPPPSLRSRDEAQNPDQSNGLHGPGARLLSPFERQFCFGVNTMRKTATPAVAPLYVSTGLVKVSKARDQGAVGLMERTSKHGRVGPGVNTVELSIPQQDGANALDLVAALDDEVKGLLSNGDFTCVGVAVGGGSITVILTGEYSDDECEEGFVPWDVPGSVDVKMSAFEKQIFHEVNLAREQPVTYQNILKKELAVNVKGSELRRDGCLTIKAPNLADKYTAAINSLGSKTTLSKVPKTTQEAHEGAKNIGSNSSEGLIVSPNQKTARTVVIQALLNPVSREILLSECGWTSMGIHSRFSPDKIEERRVTAIKFCKPDAPPPPGGGAPDLSQLEIAIFHELNLAKTSPTTYATHVKSLLSNIDGSNRYCEPGKVPVILNEGRPAYEEAIAFLEKVDPMEGFVSVPKGLQRAARDHAVDSKGGMVGHTGSDGSTLSQRISRYGSVSGGMAENVSYGQDTARDVVTQFIVDDGVPSRGHRASIFNPTYTTVGIAAGPHEKFAHCCVVDFATNYTEKE